MADFAGNSRVCPDGRRHGDVCRGKRGSAEKRAQRKGDAQTVLRNAPNEGRASQPPRVAVDEPLLGVAAEEALGERYRCLDVTDVARTKVRLDPERIVFLSKQAGAIRKV